jgi:hypothetical protein
LTDLQEENDVVSAPRHVAQLCCAAVLLHNCCEISYSNWRIRTCETILPQLDHIFRAAPCALLFCGVDIHDHEEKLQCIRYRRSQVARRMASIGKQLATKRAKMLIYIDSVTGLGMNNSRVEFAPVAWLDEEMCLKRCFISCGAGPDPILP